MISLWGSSQYAGPQAIACPYLPCRYASAALPQPVLKDLKSFLQEPIQGADPEWVN